MNTHQIPIETVFRTADPHYSRQDTNYRNRYYFRFPDNWTNDVNKDAIIGIRSIFTSTANRLVSFTLKYQYYLCDENNNTIKSFDSHDLLFNKFLDDSMQLKDLASSFYKECQDIKFTPEIIKPSNSDFTPLQLKILTNTTPFDLHYQYDNHKCDIHITPNFNYISTAYSGIQYEGKTRYIKIRYMIYKLNDDAKKIFNSQEAYLNTNFTSEETITENIWDRNSIILYSNIANDSDNQYIGHTRKYNYPVIKYYRIPGYTKEFYIDLYSTGDHQCPIYLPSDNKDEIFIEAQLLTSAEQIHGI